MAYLHIVFPNGYEQRCELSKALTRIGRHSVNDLPLPDETVSRFHAEITRRQGRYYVRDVRSRNGVVVNDVKVTEQALASEDRIEIGSIGLRFYLDTEEQYNETEDVEMVADGEDRNGPIVQTKRIMTESAVFRPDWSNLSSASQAEIQNRLKSITALCRQLLTTESPQDLLAETMDQIGCQLPYDRGCVMLIEGEEHRLVPHVSRDNRKQKTGGVKLAVSMTIAENCLRERSGVVCTDASEDKRFSAADSIRDLQLHSVLCVPLLGSERPLGIIHLESRADRYVYTDMDLDYLMSVASELSVGLEHFELREERAAQERSDLLAKTFAAVSRHIQEIVDAAEAANQKVEQAIEAGDWDTLRGHWNVVRQYSEKIGRLVSNMLHYAQTHAGEPVRGRVNTVVDEALAVVQSGATKRGVQLVVQLDEGMAEGFFHPEALRQALINLLRGAIEAAAGSSEPRVVVTTEAISEAAASLIIQDNGPGIPSDQTGRVFEPFFSTPNFAGTGLGLALAKKLIFDMGGKLECESEPGMGTTFVVTVPLKAPAPQPVEAEKPSDRSKPISFFDDEDMDSIDG